MTSEQPLRFGDIVEWDNDYGVARWIALGASATDTMDLGVWIGSYERPFSFGELNTFGVHNLDDIDVRIIRREGP